VRAKEISGQDVMAVLEIASMWTNDPAFEAAMQAMRRHRLDAGGLRRGFLALVDRHHTPPEVACVLSNGFDPDDVTEYIETYKNETGKDCSVRQAVENVVARQGIPGQSFPSVVERVLDNYRRREQIEAEREQYRNERRGLVTRR
jgi:hypothetical protein